MFQLIDINICIITTFTCFNPVCNPKQSTLKQICIIFSYKNIAMSFIVCVKQKVFMKLLVTLSLCIVLYSFSFAQYEAAVFDYSMSYFNNGQPLPAEEKILFSGPTSPDAEMVKVSIFNPKSDKELYHASWKRSPGESANTYRIPFNYRLRANQEYDVRINHYKKLQNSDKSSLENKLKEDLRFLIRETIVMEDQKVDLAISRSKFYTELNQKVYDFLNSYAFDNEWEFDGFSSTTKILIKQIKRDFDPLANDSTQRLSEEIKRYYEDRIQSLIELVDNEISDIFEQEVLFLIDKQVIRDYPTEKISGNLALNVGYGGVYLEGELDNFSYDSSPYIGLSFPLSRRINTSPVLNNTSISIGAFINDFEDQEGNKVTGPIFGKPYFVGLGYRLFRFIRLNAGAVVLEKEGTSTADGGNISIQTSDIQLKPFIGISAEVNLSVGLGNR